MLYIKASTIKDRKVAGVTWKAYSGEKRKGTWTEQRADTPRVRIDAVGEAVALLSVLSAVWSRQSLVHQDSLIGCSPASAPALHSPISPCLPLSISLPFCHRNTPPLITHNRIGYSTLELTKIHTVTVDP